MILWEACRERSSYAGAACAWRAAVYGRVAHTAKVLGGLLSWEWIRIAAVHTELLLVSWIHAGEVQKSLLWEGPHGAAGE